MRHLKRFGTGAFLIIGVVLWVEAFEWLMPHGGLVAVGILASWLLGLAIEDLRVTDQAEENLHRNIDRIEDKLRDLRMEEDDG